MKAVNRILTLKNTWNLQSSYFANSNITMSWTLEKEKYLHMPIKEKRPFYKCKDKYVTLDQIPTWQQYFATNREVISDLTSLEKAVVVKLDPMKNQPLAQRVSIYRGDITCLEIDAIVNAANEKLIIGGGVDRAIHAAAGTFLEHECASLLGCPTGNAKITGGYKIPAKYVIQTVGPIGEHPELLANCYRNCFDKLLKNGLSSIAFPCISTGAYGYPNCAAAHIACQVTREFLEANPELTRVIFCIYLDKDSKIYEKMLQLYFPIPEY